MSLRIRLVKVGRPGYRTTVNMLSGSIPSDLKKLNLNKIGKNRRWLSDLEISHLLLNYGREDALQFRHPMSETFNDYVPQSLEECYDYLKDDFPHDCKVDFWVDFCTVFYHLHPQVAEDIINSILDAPMDNHTVEGSSVTGPSPVDPDNVTPSLPWGSYIGLFIVIAIYIGWSKVKACCSNITKLSFISKGYSAMRAKMGWDPVYTSKCSVQDLEMHLNSPDEIARRNKTDKAYKEYMDKKKAYAEDPSPANKKAFEKSLENVQKTQDSILAQRRADYKASVKAYKKSGDPAIGAEARANKFMVDNTMDGKMIKNNGEMFDNPNTSIYETINSESFKVNNTDVAETMEEDYMSIASDTALVDEAEIAEGVVSTEIKSGAWQTCKRVGNKVMLAATVGMVVADTLSSLSDAAISTFLKRRRFLATFAGHERVRLTEHYVKECDMQFIYHTFNPLLNISKDVVVYSNPVEFPRAFSDYPDAAIAWENVINPVSEFFWTPTGKKMADDLRERVGIYHDEIEKFRLILTYPNPESEEGELTGYALGSELGYPLRLIEQRPELASDIEEAVHSVKKNRKLITNLFGLSFCPSLMFLNNQFRGYYKGTGGLTNQYIAYSESDTVHIKYRPFLSADFSRKFLTEVKMNVDKNPELIKFQDSKRNSGHYQSPICSADTFWEFCDKVIKRYEKCAAANASDTERLVLLWNENVPAHLVI